MGNILVLIETMDGHVRRTSLPAITFARDMASRTGKAFEIAVMGNGVESAAASLTGYGAARVHVVDGPVLAHYLANPFKGAVVALVEASGADAVVAVSSTWSRDLLPRVAAKLGAGMVSEAVGVEAAGGQVTYKRPMWAGNVIADVQVTTPKVVIGVRGTEFPPPAQTGGASPVVRAAVEIVDDGKARFVSFAPTVSERPDLAEASVVVSGGRGLGEKDSFWNTLNPLADTLGAAIGATRAVVDKGIAPNDLQVGQTGKAVAPNLYIAVALSGAIQHLAGMKNSKVIVAINKDEEAPIFAIADYCLVGDALKLVPELVATIKKS